MTIPSKRTEKIWKKVKSTMQDPCGLEKCVPPDICIGLPLRESYLFLMALGKIGHSM